MTDRPKVQYVTTSDGFDIAYYSRGEGYPIVFVQGTPFSHLDNEWDLVNYRNYNEVLAHRRKLIRYDSRGTGMSQRRVPEFTIDGLTEDLVAVVDRLGLDRFALAVVQAGGPIAIHAALTMPDRISHLVFMDAYANGRRYSEIPQVGGFLALGRSDWSLFTESLAHFFFGWDAGDPAREYAEFLRECVEQEVGIRFFEDIFTLDLSDELPKIDIPSLVLHHRRSAIPDMDAARQLASRIPNSELILLEGYWNDPQDDYEAVDNAISRHLGQEPPPPLVIESGAAAVPVTTQPSSAGLVTILFTDIEGSTTLTRTLGDAAAQSVVRAHDEVVRAALRGSGGTEIKHTGDGIMASFPLASSAIEAAVAIQQAVAERNARPGAESFHVRVGLNAGEPVAEGADLFGTSVQLARRVCDAGEPGSIVVTDVVRQLAAGKGFLFSDTGEVALKGFEDPVRLYQVRWED